MVESSRKMGVRLGMTFLEVRYSHEENSNDPWLNENAAIE